MVTHRMPPRPGELIGRAASGYILETLLGEGGMGSVYSAFNPEVGKRAAVKVVSAEVAKEPSIVDRFLVEAKAMAALDDPNVVEIYASGRFVEDGRPYIVMAHVEGQSLESLCRELGPMSLETAALIAVQVASGLDTVHSHAIIHRDIKPQNILVGPRWGRRYFVRLVDFGIAKLLNNDLASNFRTRTFGVVGTAGFMAPEQARGEKDVDARADVYSLGATLYRMLAGRTPYDGENPYVMWEKQINNEPITHLRVLRPDLPEIWCTTIMATLESDRSRRPGSTREVAQRLMQPMPNGEVMLRLLAPTLAFDKAVRPTDATFSSDVEQSMVRWAAGRSAATAARRRGPSVPVLLVSCMIAGVGIGAATMRFIGRSSRPPEQLATSPKISPAPSAAAAAMAPIPPPDAALASPTDAASVAALMDAPTFDAPTSAVAAAATAPTAPSKIRTPAVKPGTAPAPAQQKGDGDLVVRLDSWAEVYANGVHLGTAPRRFTLASGKYDLLLVNDSHRETVTVTVKPHGEAVVSKNW